MGVPFLPARTMLGTDTFRMQRRQSGRMPIHGARAWSPLPALSPDVAAIHVHEADRFGNCRIRGTTVADLELARAAKRVIITCERLIPTDEIRRDPSRTAIPFLCVDAVCEVPYGSYPGNMPYEYFSDEAHFRQWLAAEKDLDSLRQFLEEYIYGLSDFFAYVQKCGGPERMQELRRQEFLL